MNREQFLVRMQEIYNANVDISRRKNADYAHGEDGFQNFRTAEAFNRSVAEGIFFRMMDKMSRVGNGLRQELQVKDESILDTLSDLCNYSVILRMWIENERGLIKYSDARKNNAPDGITNATLSSPTLGSETPDIGNFRLPEDLTRIEDDPNEN